VREDEEADVDHEYAYLTTTGRRSGRPHRIEIWYRRIDDVVWFIAGDRERADWVRNLMADPACTVEIGFESRSGVAFLDAQDELAPREALAVRYQHWEPGEPMTMWSTEGLLVGVRLD
jgi:deazaflavin-dependent oxidoreductase (nitroreductase family)